MKFLIKITIYHHHHLHHHVIFIIIIIIIIIIITIIIISKLFDELQTTESWELPNSEDLFSEHKVMVICRCRGTEYSFLITLVSSLFSGRGPALLLHVLALHPLHLLSTVKRTRLRVAEFFFKYIISSRTKQALSWCYKICFSQRRSQFNRS